MTQENIPELHERPGNPAAVLSIITGLLLCIPGLGVVAIASGAWAIRRSRISGIGRTAATFGIVLGVVNVIWWAALAIGVVQEYRTYTLSKPVIAASKQFIMLVGSGNVSSARALCTDAITDEQLTDTAEQIQKWGSLQNVDAYYGGEVHSADDIEVQTKLNFEAVHKIFIGHWKMADHSPRLMSFNFKDAPTTQPSTQP